MSEKPRHTSNASGDNRPMYKGNRTEKSRGKKGGYKGKGFKDNRRDGNGYDRNGASGRGDKKIQPKSPIKPAFQHSQAARFRRHASRRCAHYWRARRVPALKSESP